MNDLAPHQPKYCRLCGTVHGRGGYDNGCPVTPEGEARCSACCIEASSQYGCEHCRKPSPPPKPRDDQ